MNAKPETKAINLRIEVEHEALLRATLAKIRTGGAAYRTALQALNADDAAVEYMPSSQIHNRFFRLEEEVRDLRKEMEKLKT